MPPNRTRRTARSPVPLALWRLALALIGPCATLTASAQDAPPSFTQRALAATNESTSVGMVPAGTRHPGWTGWFQDAWDGSMRILKDGDPGLLLPLVTYHAPYAYPNRHQENEYPWGAGFVSSIVDEKDNERFVYAMAISDSHYDLQPTVGYGWIARWPLAAGLKWGIGYTAFLTARADAKYIPFPAVLPLGSIGNDAFTLYGSWVPTQDVFFLFARFTLRETRGGAPLAGAEAGLPLGTGDARFRPNLLYATGAWVKVDASGIDTVASESSWAPLIGYRHFISPALAFDVSAARSHHTLDLNGARLGSFDFIPVTFTAQYHFPSFHGLRMYVGAGVAYNQITRQDMPGYSLSTASLSPVVQAGASVPITDALMLTAGLSSNFPRNQLAQGGTNLGTVKLAPATFSLGLGYAF
jgi:outer membrane protein W